MNREFLENLNIGQEAVEAILTQAGVEEESHARQMAQLRFDHALDRAIGEKKGRSNAAIRALLDLEGLMGSEEQETAIAAALDDLKKNSGFLFEGETVAPAYAAGTGSGRIHRDYSQEEIGKMSMAEYRAYRNGR